MSSDRTRTVTPPVTPQDEVRKKSGKGKKAAVGGGVAAGVLLLLWLGSLLPGWGIGIGKGTGDGDGTNDNPAAQTDPQQDNDPDVTSDDRPETDSFGNAPVLTFTTVDGKYYLRLPDASTYREVTRKELVTLAVSTTGEESSGVRVWIEQNAKGSRSADENLRDLLTTPTSGGGAGLTPDEVQTKSDLQPPIKLEKSS